jgi:hypothetical protein
MMLQHKIHRLPVVDEHSVPVGIATRTDVFEPLIATRDDILRDQDKRRCVAPAFSEPRSYSSHPRPLPQTLTRARLGFFPGRARGAAPHPRHVRLAAKPATRPHAFPRNLPLSRLSDNPRNRPPPPADPPSNEPSTEPSNEHHPPGSPS